MDYNETSGIYSFGDWVQRRRKAIGLTRGALATKIGCAEVTIKKIEEDERRPSDQIAQLLFNQLAIPNNLREDFLRMARGKYVGSLRQAEDALRIPPFLQENAHPILQNPNHFVERQREISLLEDHLKQAIEGKGRPVFISGEAGSGKTTLMVEFARRALEADPNLLVASGQCNALAGAGDPYRPLRDILGQLSGDLQATWRTGGLTREQAQRLWASIPYTLQTIAEHGPNMAGLFLPVNQVVQRIAAYLPEQAVWLDRFQALAQPDKSSSSVIDQSRILDEVTRVFATLSSHTPLLLIVDDLHWIDNASKNLLFHFGRRLADSHILLLAAYRTGEIIPVRTANPLEPAEERSLEAIIRELTRQYGDIQIDLNQTSPAEGRAFIDALLDSEPNDLNKTFREMLFRQTQGQPLFTVEVLRSLQESGKLVRDDYGKWVERETSAAYPRPARVEAVIEQRLSRLPSEGQEILEIACVEGELFSAEVLARILAMDLRTVLQRLSSDLGRRHRLVQEQNETALRMPHLTRFRFNHALFQEYLYDKLGYTEKRLLHLKVAESLEQELFGASIPDFMKLTAGKESIDTSRLDEFGATLAKHFWLGEKWDKAATYALLTGDQARKRFAMREAIVYYSQALQALDKLPETDDAIVFETILRWVEAAFKFIPYKEQLEKLSRAEAIARRLGDKQRLITALHWTGNVYLQRGFWTAAGPALTESLALAEELGEEELSVHPIYFKGLMTSFADPPGALEWLERSIPLARKYSDLTTEALALATKGQVLAQMGEYASSQKAIRAARQVAGQLNSPLTESDVDLLAAWACLAMGDIQQGLELSQRSIDKAIATDNMDCICSGMACLGYGNLELQRIPEATSAFEKGIERSDISGAMIPKLNGQAGLAMAQFVSGHPDAVKDLEKVVGEMQTFENHVGAANANRMLGMCLLQLGELEHAEKHLNAAISHYRQTQMKPYLAKTLMTLAMLQGKKGNTAEAQASQSEAESLMRSFAGGA